MKQQCNNACNQSDEDPPYTIVGNVSDNRTEHSSIHHGGYHRKDPEYVLLRIQEHRSGKYSDPDQNAEYRMNPRNRPDPDCAEHRQDQAVKKQNVFRIQHQEHCCRDKNDKSCNHENDNHRLSEISWGFSV